MTSSVPEFVRVFSTIDSLHTVGGLVEGVEYTVVASLIEVAESTYVKLSTVWNVDPTDNPSSFVAQHNDNITCWGCGQRGHSLTDCPHKTDAEKKNIFEEKRKNKGNKSGGKYNGGNSNNDGGGGKTSNNTPENSSSNNTLCKIPTKAGETHTKVINGVNRKWCNICKLWNKTHLTADHRNRRPAANYVSEQSNTNSTPAQGLNFAQQIRAQLGQQRS